jgi:hypothetical protein
MAVARICEVGATLELLPICGNNIKNNNLLTVVTPLSNRNHFLELLVNIVNVIIHSHSD